MVAVRYLLYLLFVAGAVILWPIFFMLVLGIFPFPAEPTCSLEPGGCLPPSVFEQLLNIVCIFGAIPLTALLFVAYRRWVHRILGKADA
jgi:hypothetical protein